jgi:hypothetical protein
MRFTPRTWSALPGPNVNRHRMVARGQHTRIVLHECLIESSMISSVVIASR